MRIYLDQIGCRLNYSEMESLAGRLRMVGHAIVGAPEQAQVIVFNTCAVTSDAVRGSRKQVRHFHAANLHARIAVTGCWATLASTEAAALPGVALVAGNEQKDLLHTLLEPWSAEFDDVDQIVRLRPDAPAFPFDEHAADAALQRTRAFIKVQDGCNNRCTFCIVTLARGVSRSRVVADVVREVQQWTVAGVQEAVLSGVHLGSFGRDLPGAAASNLKELVTALICDTDIARLRLSSLEPWELTEGFFDLWARWPGRLCPHLHLPLQSGSDAQLRRMARRCTSASFRQLVTDARAAIPDLILTTDLIAGFPGETEVDFAQGLAFVEEMRFAHAHIFPYSARPGTVAAAFDGQITPAVKKARARRLHELVEHTGAIERARFLGAQRPVLWEGRGQPLADQPGRLWGGLTDNYLRVQAVAPAEVDLHNRLLPTRLVGVQHGIFDGVADFADQQV